MITLEKLFSVFRKTVAPADQDTGRTVEGKRINYMVKKLTLLYKTCFNIFLN